MNKIVSVATITLPFIAIALLITQIVYTNNLAQDGTTLKEITEKIDVLSIENERLEHEIASMSSLLVVQEKALAKGFVEAKQFMTITQGQYLVAINQKR